MYENKSQNGCPPETAPATPGSQGASLSLGACAQRMSARNYLRGEAERLRREANELDELAAQIPDGFPYGADSALWTLINRQRRG